MNSLNTENLNNLLKTSDITNRSDGSKFDLTCSHLERLPNTDASVVADFKVDLDEVTSLQTFASLSHELKQVLSQEYDTQSILINLTIARKLVSFDSNFEE